MARTLDKPPRQARHVSLDPGKGPSGPAGAVRLCEQCGTSLADRHRQARFCLACRKARKRAEHTRWRHRVRPLRPRPSHCQICQQAPSQAHFNAKYCLPCRTQRRRRPRSNVTPQHAAQLRPLLGTMPVLQICERVGISKAAYQRWRMEEGITLYNKAYRPEVVEAVLRTYEQAPPFQGKQAVRETFPDVAVRSITERYRDFAPRQIRWTDAQIREAVRMAGLVSHTAQARYFCRPHAHEGAIKKLWVRRLAGCEPSTLNGLGIGGARQLVEYGCPTVLVQRMAAGVPIAKVLWLDMVEWLKPDVADEVRACVAALARWQAWLHGTTDTGAIRRMIQERERYADERPRDDERPCARPGSRDARHGQRQKHCADA